MYRIDISLDDQAELALRVERDIGINAGPMDRVAQVYEGAVFMDFTKPRSSTACGWRVHGEYTRVETDILPPLYLVWAKDNASESSRIHADVRRRWDAGDADVAESMSRLASLADDVFKAMTARRMNVEELRTSIDTNFDIRRALFGDRALGALNVQLVSVCREHAGCAAKFAGSGGACVVVCENDDRARALRDACDAHGFRVERIVVRE
jgi:glucuronokinase